MSRGGRRYALVALVAATVLGTAACGDKAPPATPGAGNVAGLPVTHFESGLRTDAPRPDLRVKNASGGEDDQLATAAIADVQAYWTEALPAEFGGKRFEPVKSLLSYDSKRDTEDTACGSVKQLVNAFYCAGDDSVAWDRGVLLPMLRKRFGPMSVVTVLAHEFGHAIQYRLGATAGISKSTPTVVKEQQADCFAAWVLPVGRRGQEQVLPGVDRGGAGPDPGRDVLHPRPGRDQRDGPAGARHGVRPDVRVPGRVREGAEGMRGDERAERAEAVD